MNFLKRKMVFAKRCRIITNTGTILADPDTDLLYVIEEDDYILRVISDKSTLAIDKDAVAGVMYDSSDIRANKACPNCGESWNDIPPVRDWTCACGCRVIFPTPLGEEVVD